VQRKIISDCLLTLYHVCDKWNFKAGVGWKIWKKKEIFVVHLAVPFMLVWGDYHQNSVTQQFSGFHDFMKLWSTCIEICPMSVKGSVCLHTLFFQGPPSLVYFFFGLIFSLDVLYLRFNLHCLLSMSAEGLHSSFLFTCLRVGNRRCRYNAGTKRLPILRLGGTM
jgi:hypothetical protein